MKRIAFLKGVGEDALAHGEHADMDMDIDTEERKYGSLPYKPT